MPDYPNPNTDDRYNDVLVDSVRATGGIATLSISSTDGGYTTVPDPNGPQDSSGNYLYPSYVETDVLVEAIANPGYSFDHWNLDGNNVGSDYQIWLAMENDHILQAVFSPEVTYHWLTVYSYDLDDPGFNLYPNVYIDSNWAGTTPVTIQVTEGVHTICVDNPYTDENWNTHAFFMWSNNDQNDPTNIAVMSDTQITALYG
jgi:hypothetical protein